MINLEDSAKIKNIDSQRVFDSLIQLPEQCSQAWKESFAIDFPEEFKKVDNIIVAGMGGSSYGVRIVKSLYDNSLTTNAPIELANDYFLPGYVSNNSLVILSSYSGNTEETLSLAKEAQKRKAKITGITSGGKLAYFLKEKSYPAYIFNPQFNPSGQPRIGVGYMVMGLAGMLSKLNLIPLDNAEIKRIVSFLSQKTILLYIGNKTKDNLAKKLAVELVEKIPVFIVADFLAGAAYAVRNPFHETGKQFALYFVIPELNHHLLEGLSYPKVMKQSLVFIFVNSDLYDERNKQRMFLTKEIVVKNGFEFKEINLQSLTAFAQTMEFIQLGNWITFYLAILHNVDPAYIPWVNYFKKKLRRRL